jgi:hypothetical protein
MKEKEIDVLHIQKRLKVFFLSQKKDKEERNELFMMK